MACGMEEVVVEVVDDNRGENWDCGNLIKLAVYWLTWHHVCVGAWQVLWGSCAVFISCHTWLCR